MRSTSFGNKIADFFRVKMKNEEKSGAKKAFLRSLSGAASGFINGFFGGGGGMVIVPMLEKVCSIREKSAHATALAVILPISLLSGFLSFNGLETDLVFLLVVTVGSAVGGVIGALFLKNARPKTINIAFYIVMIAAGVRLAFF